MLSKTLIRLAMTIAIMLGLAAITRARPTTTATAPAASRPAFFAKTIVPAKPTWNEMNVPRHSAWAKNVLLIVVWMFVLAVLAGPLVKYASNRKPPPPRPTGGAW